MIKIIILSCSLVFFSACSFKSPANQWQYQSSSAFDSYTKNFLSCNNSLAKNDLSRAIKHSKQSADLTMLCKIYLGKCALNISVGLNDSCKEYKNISELVNNKSLDAYYDFITLKEDVSHPEHLDIQYKDFALHLSKKDYIKANEDISKMSKVTSQLLAASLIKENLNSKTRQKMIDIASLYGYKKSVVFWLKETRDKINDDREAKLLSKKILILESK